MKFAKWIGAGLGWAVGGPIGAFMGLVFGSMIDGMQVQTGTYTRGQTQPGDFSVSLLLLSAAVMNADGKVTKAELEYVKQFFIRQFGIERTKEQMLMLREMLQQEIPLHEVCAQIRQYMEYPSRLQLMHFLYGISQADGLYHTKELDVIHVIARYLGISEKDQQTIQEMFIKEQADPYVILQIDRNVSDDEIKKAYRRLAVKYHPDKVSHLGEDVQKAATEKLKEINAAYEQVKKERSLN